MSHASAAPTLTVRSASEGSARFECRLREGGSDAAWVRVTGELDVATAPILARALSQADTRAQRVVLDLRELTFIDSSGVHVIIDASRRATASGRALVLVRGPEHIDRVLFLTGAADRQAIVDLHPGEPPVLALLKLAQRDRTV